jgi:hypothetical protein
MRRWPEPSETWLPYRKRYRSPGETDRLPGMRDAARRSRRGRRTLPTHYPAANRKLDELRVKPQRPVACRPAATDLGARPCQEAPRVLAARP